MKIVYVAEKDGYDRKNVPRQPVNLYCFRIHWCHVHDYAKLLRKSSCTLKTTFKGVNSV